MLTIISPAKTLDFDSPSITETYSQPDFLDQAEQIVDLLASYSSADIEKLMHISPKLADLNAHRFQHWSRPFNTNNAKQAVLAFKGDVYSGLQAETLTEPELDYAQQHLRILSGLYGVLRPLDLMQAYRLEMGTKLATDKGKNLYDFWGQEITDLLNQQLKIIGSNVLLNLASNEYFKSVQIRQVDADIVTPVFRDWKNGKYKIISFFAKKARGQMTAWVIKNQVEDIEKLADYNVDGYTYSENDSDAVNPVFIRRQDT